MLAALDLEPFDSDESLEPRGRQEWERLLSELTTEVPLLLHVPRLAAGAGSLSGGPTYAYSVPLTGSLWSIAAESP